MKTPGILFKVWAFIRRDFKIASSYRLAFILEIGYSVFILTLLYFISSMVKPDTRGLDPFGGDFFLYVTVGFGFYQYFHLSLTQFSRAVQREQVTGCLESMISTRTRPEVSILMSSLYGLLSNLVHLILVFGFAVILFGVNLPSINLLAASTAFVLAVGFFMGLGILSAAFIVVLKKGDPITWILTSANFVIGGAFFPVDLMPDWMQHISRFVPTTYALDALRRSLIIGENVSSLRKPLIILAATALVVVPLGVVVLRRAVRRAKAEGTLVFY